MATHGERLAFDFIGDVGPPALVEELAGWLTATPRFRPFVEANRAKIRRKVREARDEASARDVRAELLVAARLLADRRFDLAFEATGAERGGPDFGVTFRQGTRFNLEVTRRRGHADAAAVVDAAMAKLRQLPPSIPNVVVVAVDGGVDGEAITDGIRALRARVDARDPAVLARLRADTPRAFYDRFLRLAAVIAWTEATPGATGVWTNPSARIMLDRAASDAVVRALEGGPA